MGSSALEKEEKNKDPQNLVSVTAIPGSFMKKMYDVSTCDIHVNSRTEIGLRGIGGVIRKTDRHFQC